MPLSSHAQRQGAFASRSKPPHHSCHSPWHGRQPAQTLLPPLLAQVRLAARCSHMPCCDSVKGQHVRAQRMATCNYSRGSSPRESVLCNGGAWDSDAGVECGAQQQGRAPKGAQRPAADRLLGRLHSAMTACCMVRMRPVMPGFVGHIRACQLRAAENFVT